METTTVPAAAAGSRILLRATKFDGSAHWIQPFEVVSDDGNLLVAKYRARTPIFTSRGEFRSPYDSLVYFWRDRWYNVFRLSKPGCDLALWYCNITTPPSLDSGQLSYVDLDLDVTVRPNRCIELLDSEEFARNRRDYLYPADIVTGAESAVLQVVALAQRGGFPFSEG